MTTYLLTRGNGWQRRRAHLARFDQFGQVSAAWCGRSFNLVSNVPWGMPRCKDCQRLIAAASAASEGGS